MNTILDKLPDYKRVNTNGLAPRAPTKHNLDELLAFDQVLLAQTISDYTLNPLKDSQAKIINGVLTIMQDESAGFRTEVIEQIDPKTQVKEFQHFTKGYLDVLIKYRSLNKSDHHEITVTNVYGSSKWVKKAQKKAVNHRLPAYARESKVTLGDDLESLDEELLMSRQYRNADIGIYATKYATYKVEVNNTKPQAGVDYDPVIA